MTDLSDRAKAVLTDIEAEMSREGGGDVLQSAFEIIEELLTSPSKRVERLEALAECAKLCDDLAKDHDMAGNSDAYSAGMHDAAVRLFVGIKALGDRS